MNVEVVTDDVPAFHCGIARHDGLHMRQKIFLGARGSSKGSHELARDDITAENEGAGAVTDVLKLAPLHFARCQRQAGMLALKGLDSGQFIRAYRPFVLFGPLWSLLINLTDGSNDGFFLWISWRGQPVPDQVRLEIVFFNRRAACRGEICAMMPRAITSAASSRPVQWLMGRSLGCSHARATNWHVCSALI